MNNHSQIRTKQGQAGPDRAGHGLETHACPRTENGETERQREPESQRSEPGLRKTPPLYSSDWGEMRLTSVVVVVVVVVC